MHIMVKKVIMFCKRPFQKASKKDGQNNLKDDEKAWEIDPFLAQKHLKMAF